MCKLYKVVSSTYLAHGESEYETTLDKFKEDCLDCFGIEPILIKSGFNFVDETGELILEKISNV
jgi:hypothetical protein